MFWLFVSLFYCDLKTLFHLESCFVSVSVSFSLRSVHWDQVIISGGPKVTKIIVVTPAELHITWYIVTLPTELLTNYILITWWQLELLKWLIKWPDQSVTWWPTKWLHGEQLGLPELKLLLEHLLLSDQSSEWLSYLLRELLGDLLSVIVAVNQSS